MPKYYKRKRGGIDALLSAAAMEYQMTRPIPRSVPTRRQLLNKGYERQGGFYGRYSGTNPEMKFFDTALNFQVDGTGEIPATGQLNLIPQGATEQQRIGRKCVVRSIQLKGTWEYVPGASTVGTAVCHIYLVLDKQCNGAVAGITDVLTSNVMGSALINLSNSERFVIIRKIIFRMNTSAGVQGAFARVSGPFSFYKKCKIPLEFDPSVTTGALTSIRSNNLFLLAGTTNEDDLVGVLGTCRLRFADS